MKNNVYRLLLTFFISVSLASTTSANNTQERASGNGKCIALSKPDQYTKDIAGFPSSRMAALFDIQATYNLDSSISQLSSFAACAWTGTEWWVSQWNKDSIYTLSPTGAVTSAFRISGVGTTTSGVRSITSDGTLLYLADNTTTIKCVDPATKTVVSTITAVTLPFNCRAITYDPTIAGGAGGFWVSNFNTPIVQIDRNGNLLSSIPVATHTLTGIYGLAVDLITAGGPFLWAFDQTSAGTAANLVRLQLPTGTPTFVVHNVNLEVASATGGNTGIAGGLFITNNFFTGQNTIAGVLQGSPDDILFAMQLDVATQLANDASLDTIRWTPAHTIIPDQQLSPISFPVIGVNRGSSTITAMNCRVDAYQGAVSIFNSTGTVSNVATGASAFILPSASWTPPGIGAYRITAQSSLVGAADQNPANDTLSIRLTVSDTVFARDNGVVNGALGIGDSIGGTLGQLYSFVQADVITSVTFRCNSPTAGDSTRAVIYDYNGSTPVNVIGESDFYVFTPADTDGVLLTLPVRDYLGNPVPVAPGTYFAGVEEYLTNLSLATSNFNWRPSTAFVTFTNQPWAPVENFGFKRVFLLRLNTGSSITNISHPGINPTSFVLYPNPTTASVRIEAAEELLRYEILDLTGRFLRGENLPAGQHDQVADMSHLEHGVYLLRVLGDSGIWYERRVVRM